MEQEEVLNVLLDAGERSGKPERIINACQTGSVLQLHKEFEVWHTEKACALDYL